MKKITEQHISIPYKTLNKPEFLNLSGNATKILLYMLKYYYPKRHDRYIAMSYRELRDKFGLSFSTISSAFKELTKNNFISVEQKGCNNKASRYVINDKFFNVTKS